MEKRAKYYEVVKRHAEMLSEVTVEEESQKLVEQLSTQGIDVSEGVRKELEKMSLDEDNSESDIFTIDVLVISALYLTVKIGRAFVINFFPSY